MVLGLGAGLVSQGLEVYVYGCGGLRMTREAGARVLERAAESGLKARTDTSRRGGKLPMRTISDRLVASLTTNQDGLDLMVVHRGFGTPARKIVEACFLAEVPCVACLHDPFSPLFFANRPLLKRLYWNLSEAPLLRKMRAIHLLAPSHARYLASLGVNIPTFVVPNGLDSALVEVSGSVRGPWERSASTAALNVLYLGRLDVYHKGLDILLRAVAGDRSLRSTVSIKMAGRATKQEGRVLRRQIAALKLQDRVSFVGFLPHIAPAVRTVDLVILPSRFDGFGLVVLEALLLGTPVIVSSQAGVSEFLQQVGGVLVADPDERSLAIALRTAVESKQELNRAAASARPHLAHEFSWGVLARRWLEEIERLGVAQVRGPK